MNGRNWTDLERCYVVREADETPEERRELPCAGEPGYCYEFRDGDAWFNYHGVYCKEGGINPIFS